MIKEAEKRSNLSVQKEPKEFHPPVFSAKFAGDVLKYLSQKRGLDETLVRTLIENGDIVPSVQGGYCNVVFMGKDEKGVPRYGFVRGVHSDYRGDLAGADKRYSFRLGNMRSTTLFIYEGAIDLLSDLTLARKKGNIPEQKYSFLSTSGIVVTKDRTTGEFIAPARLPVALEQFRKDHPWVNKIYVRFDADAPGQTAARRVKEILSTEKSEIGKPIDVRIVPPKKGCKDINEQLLAQLGNPPAQLARKTLPATAQLRGIVMDGAVDLRGASMGMGKTETAEETAEL
jgi:hypothetical protein